VKTGKKAIDDKTRIPKGDLRENGLAISEIKSNKVLCADRVLKKNALYVSEDGGNKF